PAQDAGSGPNYYALNQDAVYDINIDNSGDAKPDLVFRFKFTNHFRDLKVPAGASQTAVPLINIGPFSANNSSSLNRYETYTVTRYQGAPSSKNQGQMLTSSMGSSTFNKPVDNIGNKSIPDYVSYANQYMYSNVKIPGCAATGRVFVGQRKDGFVVNLGEIFDLVNLNPVGPRNGTRNALHNKNVTTIALELPKSCLINASGDPVIGSWTTASLRSSRMINPTPKSENDAEIGIGGYTQVSRLGAPLVNELVIGLPDKNRFNASQPANDTQFLHYVTNPSLPVLLNALFGPAAQAPQTPRNDLVAAFLTGVPGLNQPANLKAPGEELRLNTSTPPTMPANQKDLGVLAGDHAGFPNGRRPYDDVVDITLRVAEGALCGMIGKCGSQTTDPNKGAAYTDGTRAAGATAATAVVRGDEYASDTYLDHFPYLATPLPGSPNGKNGVPAN
ncbi:MAG: DUF4331 domain-containing protein, partial [Pseudomonadota bacterium]|nr:DUF4331 domain-containing protein [Pseudomonadota bacterium]